MTTKRFDRAYPQQGAAIPMQEVLMKSVGGGDSIQFTLGAIRKHLGMEVAYISEFVGDQSVFRVVDAPGLERLIKSGDSKNFDDVYSGHILAGASRN